MKTRIENQTDGIYPTINKISWLITLIVKGPIGPKYEIYDWPDCPRNVNEMVTFDQI